MDVRIACRKKFYDEREATYAAVEQLKRKQVAAAMARAKSIRARKDKGEE